MFSRFISNSYYSSAPYIDENGVCSWRPIQDLDKAIEKSVIIDDDRHADHEDNEQLVLRRAHAHIGTILTNSSELPRWKVILLSPTKVLFRIDHCICDGLSAVTLLREIGVKTSSKLPLSLSDLSPILRSIEEAGDLRIALLPLRLLWPLNLFRAISLLISSLSHQSAPPNPLRPENVGSCISSEFYGTVYFPNMPVALFKDIARSIGSGTTVNDVLLLCWSITIGRYIDELKDRGLYDDHGDIDKLNVLLPIGNPLQPSKYGDRNEGLCNRMTPVVVPLSLPRDNETSSLSIKQNINEIKAYMMRVKKSNTPLLMTCLNTILAPLLSVKNFKEAAKHSFDAVSAVYTNVAGPTQSISLQSPNKDYEITGLQVVMPHPVAIFCILSYNSTMFFNITVDTRTGIDAFILRESWIEAVKTVAESVISDDKWKDQLAFLSTSKEYGGNGIVYTCGTPKAKD